MKKQDRFEDARGRLESQYSNIIYDRDSGRSREELKRKLERRLSGNPGEPRILTRAFLFHLICSEARIAPDRDNYFADKVDHCELVNELRAKWRAEEWEKEFGNDPNPSPGSFDYMVDLSHTCPDWKSILRLGFTGLRNRAARESGVFNKAAVLVYEGAINLCRRLGRASDNEALSSLSERPPKSLHEALQLAYIFHELQEMEGEPVRTMGWFDRLYIDFYREDIKSGRLSREEAKELIKYFWIGFYAKTQGRMFGKNFCFGPRANELSYLGMEVYHEMNTIDPKLSVLVDADTPLTFIEACAKNIRDGRNGIVFLNYRLAAEGLEKHGRSPDDALDFIPVGCYEPAVMGKEISCSGATHLFLPKSVELILEEGGPWASFSEFKESFFKRLLSEFKLMAERQRRCEKIWPGINPAPFLSGTMEDCVEKRMDISEGGARYNTTGCVLSYLANAVDSLAAVEYLVFKEQLCSMKTLKNALRSNWEGYERLRLSALNRAPKWGNNDDRADMLAVELARAVAPAVNSEPNGRGGKFMASIYGQKISERGKMFGALPDGRKAGAPMSKNLCASVPMDKNGVTALMDSAMKLDYRDFPCGACLDLMLHPSAVKGVKGTKTIASITRAFIAGGGTGLQFNIFDVETLMKARRDPSAYSNLQVRVCGWNALFTDLSDKEQDIFIAQAQEIS